MEKWIEKAAHLIEALPYIRRFSGKTFVIKFGGSVLPSSTQMQNMMQDIALLSFCGIRIILVHGGGPEISALCQALNVPVQFNQGQRVTDDKILEVVQMALLGKVNSALVTQLCLHGLKAIGISGQDAGFIQAKKLLRDQLDLGWVGEISSIDDKFLTTLLANALLPVVAPLAADHQGQTYNINADTVAAGIAGAMKAEKLVLLTNVNGIYANKNDPTTRMSSMDIETINTWLSNGQIQGGMIPKVQAGMRALEQGVGKVHILDGQLQHSLLLEIFTDAGIGTMLTH